MRLAILLACALSLSACAEGIGDDDLAEQPDLSGSLRVFLTTEAADGAVYRVRGVNIELSGAALLTMSDSDGVRGRESLVTNVPAGSYKAYLRPGWRLMERAADGTERELPATLISKNPLDVTVNELGVDILQLTFQYGEQELRFGGGTALRITRAELAQAPSTL